MEMGEQKVNQEKIIWLTGQSSAKGVWIFVLDSTWDSVLDSFI